MHLMNDIKKKLKGYKFILNFYSIYKSLFNFFSFKPILLIKQYFWFFSKMKELKKQNENDVFKDFEYYPCLFDNLSYTPLEPTYFFQDSWAARKIFELKPKHHYDIGSSAMTIGILSQFVPITMIDIRPISLELDNLSFVEGSILSLPLNDNSIASLSSLCVIEHIGLGRYGDTIDPFGSEKAINEIKRVLMPGGVIIMSVPVDSKNKVYFNAHRAFTRDYILELFTGFSLIEEKYHYGNNLYESYDPNKGFGTGLYMLKKLSSY